MGVGCEGDPFPLTPALSLRERENWCPACEEPKRLALFEDRPECSLSPGERVGVRGKNTFESPKRKLLLAISLLSIARDDPIAQSFLRCVHDVAVHHELCLRRALRQEFESELKVFEFLGAQIAHGLFLFDGQ
jgi:hypothetical protein